MKQIRLSQGLFALVSDEDFEHLSKYKWSASNESRKTKWYAVRFEIVCGKKVKIRMHRSVVQYAGHSIPEGHVVDHINHNSLDNRRSNLEVITQTENMRRSTGWKKKGQKYGNKVRVD